MTTATLFHDPTGRLRAPWRIAVFGVAFLLAQFTLEVVVAPIIERTAAVFGARLVLFQWVTLAALVVAHAVTFGSAETRTWGFAGLSGEYLRPSLLFFGFVLGALGIGLPCALLLAVGWLRMLPAPPGGSLAFALRILLVLAPAAFAEELLFRGYVFAALREVWGDAATLAVTSIGFGLVHLTNPGATVESIALVTVAGVFLGAIRLVTHSLYAAALAHLGWNWVLAAVVHSAVSGLAVPTPDYRVVDAGPDWATGGAWGPEGGAAAGLGMAAGLVIMYLHTRRRREEH